MVRKARIGDVRAIQQLLAAYARQGKLLARSLSELYTHLRDIFVHVDAESDQVTGCCSLHIVWENLAEIRSVAVSEDYLGQGIGRQLLARGLLAAYDRGARTSFLEVRRSNIAAIDMYYQFGFEIVGERRGYYQDNHEDALLMTLSELDPAAAIAPGHLDLQAHEAASAAGSGNASSTVWKIGRAMRRAHQV